MKGDIGNDLIAISEEPNVRIMETKGMLCNVLPGRRSSAEKTDWQPKSAQGESRMTPNRISY